MIEKETGVSIVGEGEKEVSPSGSAREGPSGPTEAHTCSEWRLSSEPPHLPRAALSSQTAARPAVFPSAPHRMLLLAGSAVRNRVAARL